MSTFGNSASSAMLPKSCLTVLLVVLVLAAMALGGCNAVLVKEPLGDVAVSLDPATWQGTWVTDEVVILTTILDGEKGVLQAAWVERGPEGKGANFETVTGMVRQTGDMFFLNIEKEPPEERGTAAATDAPPVAAAVAQAPVTGVPVSPEYGWGRIDNNGKRMILWMPDVEQFRQAVRDARLPGTVTGDDDVVLGPLDPAQFELINSPAGKLLNWSEPLVFVRIGD
jgi:hypothetical protein